MATGDLAPRWWVVLGKDREGNLTRVGIVEAREKPENTYWGPLPRKLDAIAMARSAIKGDLPRPESPLTRRGVLAFGKGGRKNPPRRGRKGRKVVRYIVYAVGTGPGSVNGEVVYAYTDTVKDAEKVVDQLHREHRGARIVGYETRSNPGGMLKPADVSVTKLRDGAWECAAMIDGRRVHRYYYGYSKRDAIATFIRDAKGDRENPRGRMVTRSRLHRPNPLLTVLGNPGGAVQTFSTRAVELSYEHKYEPEDQSKGKIVRHHPFKPGVNITALADGRVVLWRKDGKPVWVDDGRGDTHP